MSSDGSVNSVIERNLRYALEQTSHLFRKAKGPHRPGYVYFIRGGRNIKIGQSRNAFDRLAELQASNADTLTMLHTIETNDMACCELLFHRMFEHRRFRGEWFSIEESDLAELVGIKRLNFGRETDCSHLLTGVNSKTNPDTEDHCIRCGKPIAELPSDDAFCCRCRYGPLFSKSIGDAEPMDCFTYTTSEGLVSFRINSGMIVGSLCGDKEVRRDW